ncbi:MAG: hypothetical protein K0S79_166 [Nitrospira sp.]|jgi:hypothetical protein|nr:hypothetical protein [Nitrospira sp.]
MNRLLEIGFVPSGHWLLEDEKVTFELTRHATQRNILYAFVCDGQVKYVGKTVRPLAVRMSGYKNPAPSQSTNVNNNRRILEQLTKGVAVEIFALPDNGLHHYGQFHLNLAAALEDDIIRLLKPEWNGGKTEPVQEQAAEDSVAPFPVNAARHVLVFTLQPTYFRKGFFNVAVADEKWFGADGEQIEMFLGNGKEPVLGTINRRANSNGTPRIMGGTALRDWFASEAETMSQLAVEVLSPTSIRISRSG